MSPDLVVSEARMINSCFAPVKVRLPDFFHFSPRLLLTCPSTAGGIHIWDRESGTLLHHVHAQSLGDGDLTCVAWNPTAEPFMFATGSHDGAVRIWNTVSISTPSRDRHGRLGYLSPSCDTPHPSYTSTSDPAPSTRLGNSGSGNYLV